MRRIVVLIFFLVSCGSYARSGSNAGPQPLMVDSKSECITLCESHLTACSVMDGFRDTNNQCVAEWQQCTALCYARTR